MVRFHPATRLLGVPVVRARALPRRRARVGRLLTLVGPAPPRRDADEPQGLLGDPVVRDVARERRAHGRLVEPDVGERVPVRAVLALRLGREVVAHGRSCPAGHARSSSS